MADAAKVEKDEFFRIIIEQKDNENKERRIKTQKKDAFYQHKDDLMT